MCGPALWRSLLRERSRRHFRNLLGGRSWPTHPAKESTWWPARSVKRIAVPTVTREAISSDLFGLLNQLARDWEYSGDISSEKFLFADLGFESIDAVVLASFIQEHYRRQFPFPELLAELGRRDVQDIRLGELVEFIHR